MIYQTSFNKIASKNANANLTVHHDLSNERKWLEYIIPEKYFQSFASRSDYKYNFEFRDKIEKIKKEISLDSFIIPKFKSYCDENITHAGLIYYLNYCWAKEIGVSLRPDIFWYTIVSEIAREIVSNPNKFKHLFSNQSEKIKLTTFTNLDYDINLDAVDNLLEKNILNKEFKNLITNIHFDSQPDNFDLAIKIAFAYMASPFFEYLTYRCGIPQIEILGSHQEYELLYENILKLKNYVPEFTEYLDNCSKLINDLIYWRFNDTQRTTFLKECKSVEMFLSAIFYINKNCGSGHPYIINGWIKKLYINKYSDLSEYPAHLNYIPYEFLNNNTYYYKAIGLCHSQYDKENNILRPQYGYVIHQVLDNNLFSYLKN